MPELIAQMQSSEPSERASAAEAIGKMGRKASGALPNLEARILDSSPKVRAYAIDAIRNIDHYFTSTKEKIVEALGDSEPFVVQMALIFIARYSLYDDDLKSKIMPLLASRNPLIREDAAYVLARSEVLDKSYRVSLETLLDDEKLAVRTEAFLALLNFKLISDASVKKFVGLCALGDYGAIKTLKWNSQMLKKLRFNKAEVDDLVAERDITRDAWREKILNSLDLKPHDIVGDRAHNNWAKVWEVGSDAAVMGYNSYEMVTDGHKELAIAADSLVLAGEFFIKEKPLNDKGMTIGDGVQLFGLAPLLLYPLIGLYDGYAHGDEGKVTRAWTAVGISTVSIVLEANFDLDKHLVRVAGISSPGKVRLRRLDGGGELVASWRY